MTDYRRLAKIVTVSVGMYLLGRFSPSEMWTAFPASMLGLLAVNAAKVPQP